MKLYYAPGACSLTPHFVLNEAGFSFEEESVDLATKKTASGGDFNDINPKSYVPTLVLDDGQVLTEVIATVLYLADQKPEKKLAPEPGTIERARLYEWLAFISTELHKNFSPLYNPAASDDWKAAAIEQIKKRFDYVSAQLDGKTYVMGDEFTVADCYLFNVLSWTSFVEMDISPWPVLGAYMGRIGERPAIQDTLRAEGLME